MLVSLLGLKKPVFTAWFPNTGFRSSLITGAMGLHQFAQSPLESEVTRDVD